MINFDKFKNNLNNYENRMKQMMHDAIDAMNSDKFHNYLNSEFDWVTKRGVYYIVITPDNLPRKARKYLGNISDDERMAFLTKTFNDMNIDIEFAKPARGLWSWNYGIYNSNEMYLEPMI